MAEAACIRRAKAAVHSPEIRPGDVRTVNGTPVLVLSPFAGHEDDGTVRCCPLKPVAESADMTTGKVVFVSLSTKETGIDLFTAIMQDFALNGIAAALAEFTTPVYKDLVGGLLWRVFPSELAKADRASRAVFADDPSGRFDIEHQNSEEDWGLYKKVSAESWERIFSYEADTLVEANGSMRLETKRERRNRLARRRRAIKKIATDAAEAPASSVTPHFDQTACSGSCPHYGQVNKPCPSCGGLLARL